MMRLVVSAGHGGGDPGAVYNGKKEADIARQITAEIIAQAKTMGITVTDCTTAGNLKGAIALANKSGADLALQIHLNAGVGNAHDKKYGVEVWYSAKTTAATRDLAGAIAAKLNAHYGLPNRGAKPDSANRYGRLGWCSDTTMPALLIEWGFIDSADMDVILKDIPGGVQTLLDTIYGQGLPISILPDPTSPQDPPSPTIKQGSKGPAVVDWQKALMAKGYSLPKYGADGDFGAETKSATMKFQQNHGLAVDAVVGSKTRSAAGI